MNSIYLYDYANWFERVLAVAYVRQYSLNGLERLISYSPFFQKIERDSLMAPVIDDYTLIRTFFPYMKINLDEIPVYNQCLWAAESYLRIQKETGLTFEAIFLYCPIKKMYEYFELFHEMDFSQIVNEFKGLYLKQSILDILLKRFKYTIAYVTEKTSISSETLYSVKSRRRDIKKLNVESVTKIANVFNVRIETIAELKTQ